MWEEAGNGGSQSGQSGNQDERKGGDSLSRQQAKAVTCDYEIRLCPHCRKYVAGNAPLQCPCGYAWKSGNTG